MYSVNSTDTSFFSLYKLKFTAMEKFIDLLQRNKWFRLPLAILVTLYFLAVPSCSKDKFDDESMETYSSSKSGKIKWVGKVKDIDGNWYKKVKIGKQVWMSENLRTSRYNDGTPIPEVKDLTEWSNLEGGAFCWYNNDSAAYDNVYGKLYNFAAVRTEKLCPTGWHVPSLTEWRALCDPFKSGEPIGSEPQGNELIEAGTTHWDVLFGTNETGFTALPGGVRLAEFPGAYYTDFMDLGHYAMFYSADFHFPEAPYFQIMPYLNSTGNTPNSIMGYYLDGLSVRCLKN